MSPEQVRGERATPASDLWALGATLYAAVEGRPPFTAPSHGGLFVAIATQEPAPPRCGGPLAHLLHGLLSKDPAARLSPAQVRDLLQAVSDDGEPPLAEHRPPSPEPATRVEPASTGARRHPVAVRGALVAAWIAIAAALLLPRDFADPIGLSILLEVAPRWLEVALVVAVLLSCLLWNMTDRPAFVLPAVAVFAVLLTLAAPSSYDAIVINELGESDRAPDIGFGLAWAWLAGAVALMFAFAGVNASLEARMPRPALLRTAVVIEGALAVLWLPLVFWTLGIGMDADMSRHVGSEARAWALMGVLAAVFTVWVAAQAASRRRHRGPEPAR